MSDTRHICDYPQCSERGSGHPLACNCRSSAADQIKTSLTEGKHVTMIGDHPWYGETGELVRRKRYGPAGMFEGWLVRLSGGNEVYANDKQVRPL